MLGFHASRGLGDEPGVYVYLRDTGEIRDAAKLIVLFTSCSALKTEPSSISRTGFAGR